MSRFQRKQQKQVHEDDTSSNKQHNNTNKRSTSKAKSAPRKEPTTEGTVLKKGVTLGPYDVVCGRDKWALNNIGNRRLRVTINCFLQSYLAAGSRAAKSLVIQQVVQLIEACGGRFLKYCPQNDQWTILSPRQSHDKCSHAFRDRVAAHQQQQRQQERREKRASRRMEAARKGKAASSDEVMDDAQSEDTKPEGIPSSCNKVSSMKRAVSDTATSINTSTSMSTDDETTSSPSSSIMLPDITKSLPPPSQLLLPPLPMHPPPHSHPSEEDHDDMMMAFAVDWGDSTHAQGPASAAGATKEDARDDSNEKKHPNEHNRDHKENDADDETTVTASNLTLPGIHFDKHDDLDLGLHACLRPMDEED